ncbi:DUF6702 family protein [Foetidibacter luteolus]|uniref:DUF6702 family protein n=1 Tax=Foetidibacter luteolus TaxID=2608880 RepID=UPI00129B1484|nr:DUF6702 family protein [Foetidibacter luteolus]
MANIFFQCLMMAFGAMHPFYVSMTDINHNAKDQSLEISVRIFTDDFETTLHNNYKEKINLTNPANHAEMNRVVNDYIVKHLQLQANGKTVALSFVGFEQQSESTWTYFEVKGLTTLKNVTITNSLLHDYRKEQINMIHVKARGKEQSTKLDYPETQASFTF